MNFSKIYGKEEYSVQIKDEYRSTIKSVTVPPKYNGLPVTEIASGAFQQCTNLSNVVLPDTIKSINGWYVFADTGLKSIELPDNISDVPSYCFEGCESLKSVKLPSKLIRIGDFAFNGCTSLTNITLPNSIQEIDMLAFQSCDSLESLTIPKSVKKLGGLFASSRTNFKLIFEDTSGWQKRYACIPSPSLIFGDWENVDPAVMANSDSFRNLMHTSYKDSKGNVYYYEFQKV